MIDIKSAKETLSELRWTADQVVTNAFGERVWLKKIKGGLTDCCLVAEPCEHHERLTHSAPGALQ